MQREQPPFVGEFIRPSIIAPLDELEEQTRYDSNYHDSSKFGTLESNPENKVGKLMKRRGGFMSILKLTCKMSNFVKTMTLNIIECLKDAVIKYGIAWRYDL